MAVKVGILGICRKIIGWNNIDSRESYMYLHSTRGNYFYCVLGGGGLGYFNAGVQMVDVNCKTSANC